jgi:uncharacterized iron-regulated membrane protein
LFDTYCEKVAIKLALSGSDRTLSTLVGKLSIASLLLARVSTRMKVRKVALILHRVVGVMVGLLLVVIGLTGSSLVFWHEIDESRNPQLMRVVPQGDRISPDAILKPVQTAYPDLKLESIDLPRTPEETYKVGLKSKDDKWIDTYVNPYTGAILGQRQWGRTLMTFIYDIHMTLLAGEVGGIVVGICGILLLLLGISGVILWPGWKQFAQGFKIRWKSPVQLVNYDIHKVGGILSTVFLLLIAFTGAAMIFYTQFEGAVYWLTGTPKPPDAKSTVIANSAPMAVEAILQNANAALPGGETTYISLPKKPDGAFRVTKKLDRELTPHGRSRVFLDQYSGEVLRVENALEAPLANRILNALFPLHIGIYGGLAMRILYIFIGLAPTVLFITGFALWWSKTYAVRARRRQTAKS